MEENSASNKTRSWKLTKREQTITIVVLAFGLLGGWLPERISVATSKSVGHRIFFLSQPATKVNMGDFLVFRHKADLPFAQKSLTDNDRMIKIVGCTSGKSLTVDTGRQFMCDGKPLGTALETDSQGNPLPQFAFSGQIPAGKLFMVGTDPRSFDSKYFGFIDEREILYRATPIL